MTRRHDPQDPGPRSAEIDPVLEGRLHAWLDSEPGSPPEALQDAIAAEVRHTRQLPGWAARARQGLSPHVRTIQLRGSLAWVAIVIVTVALAWSVAAGPAVPSPSPVATAPSLAPTGSIPASPRSFGGRGVAELELEAPAIGLGAGFGSLWVGDTAGRLLRVDPTGSRVVASIELGGVPCGPIVAAAGSIWLTTCGEGLTPDAATTIRIDPSLNTVVDRYDDPGGDGAGVSAMTGLVWFISNVQEGRLTAVDAVSGVFAAELSVGLPVRHLTAGFGSLWVSPIGQPRVLRLDAATGARLADIPLSGDPAYLLTGSDAIWVAEPHQWLVGRIDPVSDRVAAEIGASPGVDHLVPCESGCIWSLAEAEAMAIDPVTNLTADRFSVPPHVRRDGVATDVLAVLGDTVWFADGLVLVRIAAA